MGKKQKLSCYQNTKYQGETGRNGYSRGLEHAAALESMQDTSPLWKHCEMHHGGQVVNFEITCLRSFKSAFFRHTNEGVRNVCSKADICMNSRTEWHQP